MTYGPTVPFSEEIHRTKYRGEGESFPEAVNRIAGALKDDKEHFHSFREILQDMRFLPAGRVQTAVGSTKNVTPYNCFVSGTIEDSFIQGHGSIMNMAKEAASTMRMGGGIGYDFSTLRPRGDLIRKLHSQSSGPVSFMEIFDGICRCVSSSGHRRGAQMGVLRVDHPDIEEFIHAKQPGAEARPIMDQLEKCEEGSAEWLQWYQALQAVYKLTGFNVSLAITDEFMECVRDDKPFTLKFGGRDYRQVDALALWDTIMRSTWDWAEPGCLFIDRINEMNNLHYCETIAATNPCVVGETPILTKHGWKEIESLVGEEVEIWNGEAWSSVTPRVTGEDQPTLEVTLSDGNSLTCTPYHEFSLSDGSVKQAKELQEGDRLENWDKPIIESGGDVPDAYEQGFFQGDGWFDQRERTWIGLWGVKKKLISEFSYQKVYEYQCGGFENTDTSQTNLRLYLGKNAKRPKDFVPGPDWSIRSRLEWFAGLADADGYFSRNSPRSGCVQVTMKSQDFCRRVGHMLQTLGCDGSFGPTHECWRTGLKATEIKKLEELGLRFRRLDTSKNDPAWSNRIPIKVVSVEDGRKADKVYCFTEPIRSRGVFNGVLTRQCAEQPLPPYGACLLGSFNLTKYVIQTDEIFEFDFEQLREDIPHVVRAMDNVVDRARYPLYEQEKEAKSKRRMGLGVTGAANAIEACGFAYGSEGFCNMLGQILETIRDHCYIASAKLAKEKGPFPLYDEEQYLAGEFIKELPDDIRALIRTHGIRNSHLASIAPTGTISMTANNVSSGVEPVFAYRQERIVNMPDGQITTELVDYGVSEFGIEGKRSSDTTVQEHLDVLAKSTQFVDSAVSKTCNVPGETPWDEFKQLYMKAWERGCKGLTTYTLGGKRSGIIKSTDEDDKKPAACRYDPESGTRTCED